MTVGNRSILVVIGLVAAAVVMSVLIGKPHSLQSNPTVVSPMVAPPPRASARSGNDSHGESAAARGDRVFSQMQKRFQGQAQMRDAWSLSTERDLSLAMQEFSRGMHLDLPTMAEASCGHEMCMIKLPLKNGADMIEWGDTFPLMISDVLPVLTFIPRYETDGSVVLYAFGSRLPDKRA